MKCYFRSFDAGIGDCNIIRLVKDEGEQYVIMVDCGSYTEPLKEYLQNALHNHIDLLIATHIDGDHIQGIATMLKKHEGLTVGEIWYNCYKRTKGAEYMELNDQQKAILKQIQKALPVEFDAINYREVTATQGKHLLKLSFAMRNLKECGKRNISRVIQKTLIYPEVLERLFFLPPSKKH